MESSCNADHFHCGGSFPSSVCCPNNTGCLNIGSTSNVICCPDGQDCNTIEPISCDASKPHGFWTADSRQSPTCGTGCCPPSFICKHGVCESELSIKAAVNSVHSVHSHTTTFRTGTSTKKQQGSTKTSKHAAVKHDKATTLPHPPNSTSSTPPSSHRAHTGGTSSSTSGTGLSATTKALITVLAVVMFVAIGSVCIWCLYKRYARRRAVAICHEIEKAELRATAGFWRCRQKRWTPCRLQKRCMLRPNVLR